LCCVLSCRVLCCVALRCVLSCRVRRVVLCRILSFHVLSCRVVFRCVALFSRLVLSCVVSCRGCVVLYPCSVELVSESQVSSISDTPFGMHNRVLDIFPFSNKVILKFYLGQFKCY